MTGLILALLLSACAGATIIGAGCRTYAEARKALPRDDLAETPAAIAGWIDSLDAGMTVACLK